MGVSEDSQELHRLARAVMAGELTREEYRRQRGVLIDRHAGDVPMTSQPLAALRDPVLRASTEQAASNALTGNRRASGNRADLWIGVAAVGIVLLVIAGLLAFLW